jgi:hypothetical protein
VGYWRSPTGSSREQTSSLPSCNPPPPAAAHTYENATLPRVPTFDSAPITMPETPVLINDKPRRLRCLIEGENVVFTAQVPSNFEVGDLEEVIQSERVLGVLKDIGTVEGESYRVAIESRCKLTWLTSPPFQPNDSNPITAQPADTLASERIRSLGDSLSQFANKLDRSYGQPVQYLSKVTSSSKRAPPRNCAARSDLLVSERISTAERC